MCGACGAGPSKPPPEARSAGGLGALRRRAAEAQNLSGGRLRVAPYGDFGYLVSTRTGVSIVRADLAGLVDALLALGGPARELATAAGVELEDGTKRGTVAAAVLERLPPG